MANFKVRARTIDMLGRQQIAGIPTALSELFKNAHDAYAQRVEVDYFRDDKLLVLRDDGLGMTRDDFEQRWLTLGTDSKVNSSAGLAPPPVDLNQGIRPILGEKGIGRLAIAVIGPQVLILTRAKRDKRPQTTLTAAYIHWGVFELPGVDLNEIAVPIEEFDATDLPDEDQVNSLVKAAMSSLDAMKDRIDQEQFQKIYSEMSAFSVSPSEISTYLTDPSLVGDGCGTHFYISPTDNLIESDIDNRDAEYKATRFEKHLIGFTNTMTVTEDSKPPIVARFRDYVDEGAPIERLGENAFFTKREFSEVDHHISGRFDEFGQFRGKVAVYQTSPEDYVLNWAEGDGYQTKCGPFDITFAVLQGNIRDSLVAPQEYALLTKKLQKHGGLYIYKDGIRVQPYGDSDYDFLDIEKRRTLGAAYYYYSYRRMMGVIELNGHDNFELTEKAGREGFRENRAYRQFRSILMNFFLQSAADFFREDGRYAEGWEATRADLQRNAELRAKKAKQSSSKKRAFQAGLTQFFDKIENRTPEVSVNVQLETLTQKVNEVLRSRRDESSKALALMRIEKEGKDAIQALQGDLLVQKPRGVGLSRTINNEWLAYQEQNKRLEERIFAPAANQIADIISKGAEQYAVKIDQTARFLGGIRAFIGVHRDLIKQVRNDADADLRKLNEIGRKRLADGFRKIQKASDECLTEASTIVSDKIRTDKLAEERNRLEVEFGLLFEKEQSGIISFRSQIGLLISYLDGDGFDANDLTEALEEELDALREQRSSELELAQIGLAISVVNHEFEKTVRALREGFRRMKAWAEANPAATELYTSMRTAFDHLDGYLELFTPFDRRYNKEKSNILGKDVLDFLSAIFEDQLQKNSIELISTATFREHRWLGYTSTFYPVFVNLVDNAIFWLSNSNNHSKKITLDVKDGNLLVSDNGPGISPRDRENIFILNFTRKPGGRGMGLYISRQSLAKEDYQLVLDETDIGTTFRLQPVSEKNT
ncbi:ATP-binding protein [Phyllobacterium sp. SB3]|uniref:ATP-binding protein n=1 Tax=Phyllobacterium sp. SB3 TaxID=3156073 RepID=UPI0032AFAD71